MIFEQFKRLWKSKINILIMLFMFIPIVMLVSRNIEDRNEHLELYEMNTAAGFDGYENLEVYESLAGGLWHFERIFFGQTGFLFFSLIVFMIGMGVHVAGNLLDDLQTGYGAMQVSKTGYLKYLKQALTAKFFYLFTFTMSFFILVFIAVLLLEGKGFYIASGTSIPQFSLPLYLGVHLLLVIYTSLSVSLLVLLASVSFVFVKNKYVLQAIPLASFVGVYIFAFMFGNLTNLLNLVARSLIFEHSLVELASHFSEFAGGGTVWFSILYLGSLLIITGVIYLINVKYFERHYV